MISPKTVLLVEDNADDEALVRRVLHKTGRDLRLLTARDGREALDYLDSIRPDGRSPGTPMPRLVLLDLKMPRLSGTETLREINADPWLRLLPIVVFTSSAEDVDVRECYRLGAASYVRKPIEYEEYARSLASVLDYWLDVNIERPQDMGNHSRFSY